MSVGHVIKSFLPANIAEWKMEANYINGATIATARRTGVTFIIMQRDGWWTITKMQGGKVLETKQTKNIPADLAKTIDQRRRKLCTATVASGASLR